MIEGLVGLTAMMLIAFLRVPIAYAMGIVGIVGYAYMRDWNWAVAFAIAQTKIYETGRNYTLSVVPLFILMGNFVTRASMSQELAALLESARTTAMLFLILIGALMFAEFINITTMPSDLKAFVSRFALHPIMVVAAICAIYVVLGTAMEELSMVLLTMPVFFPVIVHLGFDPVWFGIIIVCVVEIGLISPPVGMNMFVLKTLLPEVPTGTVFRGVMPFMWADVLRLAILVTFPAVSLTLPGMMR